MLTAPYLACVRPGGRYRVQPHGRYEEGVVTDVKSARSSKSTISGQAA